MDYQAFCGIPNSEEKQSDDDPYEISVEELHSLLQSNNPCNILDVREIYETEIAKLDGSI